MAGLLPAAKWRLPKNDGTNAAGWVVKTYTTGGPVTGKATYTTAAATVSNGSQFTPSISFTTTRGRDTATS